jgi:hypothetical protein
MGRRFLRAGGQIVEQSLGLALALIDSRHCLTGVRSVIERDEIMPIAQLVASTVTEILDESQECFKIW